MSGEKNPVYLTNIFNFYIWLSAISRIYFYFYQEIIVAQIQVKFKEQQQGVAVLGSSHSTNKLSREKSDYLTKLYNNLGGGRLEFSPAIYGTKVSQVNQVSNKYREIIGGSYPNNFISPNWL